MIRRWKVQEFKSIATADLPLAPLTLFAGANSSGKSTLLQSILLIAQTLSSRVSTQRILLNGQFTKLGQFDDLRPSWSQRSGTQKTNVIQIGWEASIQRQGGPSPYRTPTVLETISGEIAFGSSSDKTTQLNPILMECSISGTVAPQGGIVGGKPFIKLKRKAGTPTPRPEGASTEPERPEIFTWNFDFTVSMDEESQEYLRDELARATPEGVSLDHFLPNLLAVQFSKNEEIKRTIINAVTDPRSARQVARHIVPAEILIPQEVIEVLRQTVPAFLPLISRLAQKADDPKQVRMTLAELIEQARQIRSSMRVSAKDIQAPAELRDALSRHFPEEMALTVVSLPGRVLENVVAQTSTFFNRNIRYLGPLREEPKSLYPLQTTADPQDVGLHGEHTAAVFHNFQWTDVSYIPSSCFATDTLEKAPVKKNLRAAVFDWLSYLDVASKVGTQDEGKLGHGLRVYLDGSDTAHDLPHVGVGVSQVFPIVVMCLLAIPDSTLIIEQPELHLNPKVQTRLADFFLSMALLSKQCVIETHSEYLISRLRLRSVLAPSDSLSSLIKMYFVEKVKGVTKYRDVKINEYGAIVDWPAGFFDQSQREIENILLAASEKAAQKGKANS